MPCISCGAMESGNWVDLISFIIECIFGMECIKDCLKKSPDHYLCYKFLLRFICLIVGMGFDLFSFYVTYPGFYTGYESS